MKIRETCLPEVFEVDLDIYNDERGSFVKIFNYDFFYKEDLSLNFKECFYSISKKNVLRGMHYQKPPFDHYKLVSVIKGEVLDVVVNINRESRDFGSFYSQILSEDKNNALLIGKNYAHGFYAISQDSCVSYLTTTVHNPEHDSGILWSSFGFDWKIRNPIISKRDSLHPLIEEI